MENRPEFVAAVKELIDVAMECIEPLDYPFALEAFSIILRHLLADLDP